MTKEDIISMAREAGFADGVAEIVGLEGFARFVALVVAAERERIKQKNAPEIERINAYIKELEEAMPPKILRSIRAKGGTHDLTISI